MGRRRQDNRHSHFLQRDVVDLQGDHQHSMARFRANNVLGKENVMSISTKTKVLGASLVAVLGLVTLVVSLQTFVFSGGVSASTKPDVQPDLAVLSAAATSADDLTPDLAAIATDIGDGGIQLGSVRYLGESKNGVFWTAIDLGGNVCLLFQTPSALMGHTCGAASQFNEEGVAVAIEGFDEKGLSQGYLSARLLPDRADTASTRTYTSEVPNVIGISPELRAEGGTEITVPTNSGEPLKIHVLGEVEDGESTP